MIFYSLSFWVVSFLLFWFIYFVFLFFIFFSFPMDFVILKITKRKKKKKFTRRPFFFFFIHTIRWVKDDGGWQVLFIEKYHPEMPKQTQSFFCFFSKSLFFIRKKSFRLSKRDTQIGWVGWRPRPQRSVKWIPNGGKKRVCESHKEKNFFSRLFFFLFCCWFCSRPYPKCFQLMNLTKMKYRLRL